MSDSTGSAKFQIFREKDAKQLHETGIRSMPKFTPAQQEGFMAMHRPGMARGE